nr:Centrosomal protein of 131 kDa [Polyrhizophydium stewartii]
MRAAAHNNARSVEILDDAPPAHCAALLSQAAAFQYEYEDDFEPIDVSFGDPSNIEIHTADRSTPRAVPDFSPLRHSASALIAPFAAPPTGRRIDYRLDLGRATQHDAAYRLDLTSARPPEPSLGAPASSYLPTSNADETASHDDVAATKRVDRILEFLKQVEDEDRLVARAPAAPQPNPVAMMAELLKEPSTVAATKIAPETTNNARGAAAVFDGVKAKIMGQQMEIEEKTRAIDLLKAELKKIKDALKDQAAQHQKTLKSQLTLQRKEYETIVNRHLAFVDKLLAEKEALSKRCEELTAEVKQLEKQFLDKFKGLEEQHGRDIKQQREMWQAAEKIKRDKWIQEKTKSIKDQTVKGLEPEIQRMIAQHKAQVRDLEEKYREQFAKEKALLSEQHQRQLDAIRDRSVAERQKACEDEREFARQRYLKQLERDEMEFQQQKRKMLADFDEQKHNLVESIKEERKLDEQAHRKAVDELRRQVDAERAAKEQALEELRKKHLTEVQQLRERMQVEKEEWQTHYMKKTEADIRAKEVRAHFLRQATKLLRHADTYAYNPLLIQKLFKEKLIKERDAEIEMVIQRLESENNSSTSDATRKYRMDMERLKANTADEIKHVCGSLPAPAAALRKVLTISPLSQLRDQHSLALDKVLAAQGTIAQLEEHRRKLQKEILQLQHETAAKDATIRQQKAELARLKVDEQTLMGTIRREFDEQIDAKEAAIRSLTGQISMLHEQTEVLRRKYEQELDAFLAEKEASMAQIEDRVKHTLRQKDEIIAALKTQHEELALRNGQLETLIEKQRQVGESAAGCCACTTLTRRPVQELLA